MRSAHPTHMNSFIDTSGEKRFSVRKFQFLLEINKFPYTHTHTFSLPPVQVHSVPAVIRRLCSQPLWEQCDIVSNIEIEKLQILLINYLFCFQEDVSRPWTHRLPLPLKRVNTTYGR